MKRLLVLGLVLPFCALMARADDEHRGHVSTVTMNDDSASDDCRDHLRTYDSDYRTTVRDEESKTIPNQPLKITADHNGGIQVTSWDKPEISLKLCKQIAVDDESAGRKLWPILTSRSTDPALPSARRSRTIIHSVRFCW